MVSHDCDCECRNNVRAFIREQLIAISRKKSFICNICCNDVGEFEYLQCIKRKNVMCKRCYREIKPMVVAPHVSIAALRIPLIGVKRYAYHQYQFAIHQHSNVGG